MIRLCFALAFFVGLASPIAVAAPSSDPKSLDVPEAESTKARQLVQQLGSEDFIEREDAQRKLMTMGRFAYYAIRDGANTDPSAEIRSRCHAIFPQAAALEFKARLEVFVADAEGKYEHDLPGWNEFRVALRKNWSLFGYTVWTDHSLDKPARAVFAELIATPENWNLLKATSGNPAELAPLVTARRQELGMSMNQGNGNMVIIVNGQRMDSQAPRRPATASDIATLLFAESLVPTKAAPQVNFGRSISMLLDPSGFAAEAKNADDRGMVYRAIATSWVESRQDINDIQQAVSVAAQLGMLDHSCRLAARIFNMPAAQPFIRGNVTTNLVAYGDKRHLPLVEKALTDTTVLITLNQVLGGNRKQIEIQVRDVALAVSVLLSGQKLEDYDFMDQHKNIRNVGGAGYSFNRYYIPDDKRDAAFIKWKEWREKNP